MGALATLWSWLTGGTAEATHAPVPPVAGEHPVHLRAVGRSKIAVIKAVRTHTQLGLAVTKGLVESAPVVVHWAPTADAAMAMVHDLIEAGASAYAGPGPALQPSAAGVWVALDSMNGNKIATIRALRGALGLGLKEAKETAESAPVRLGPFDEDKALELLLALTEARAQARID